MLNVPRCSSCFLFFWVLIRFDKKILSFFFFKFDFVLDSNLGLSLFFMSNQRTLVQFMVELKVLDQLGRVKG
jgi:hypothetical protein